MSEIQRRELPEDPPRQMAWLGRNEDFERRKKEARRSIGRGLDRAIRRAEITQKAVASDMGYADSSVIGRWVNGNERLPPLEHIKAALPQLYAELLLALLLDTTSYQVEQYFTVKKVG
jgi:hypothetical protein